MPQAHDTGITPAVRLPMQRGWLGSPFSIARRASGSDTDAREESPMRTIDPAHIPAMIALEQTLYDYCAELDAGAARVTDYFTDDCAFHIGETVWHGHAGLKEHYAADAAAVKEYYQDGRRTVRHGLLNLRIRIEDATNAAVDLIFLNFSAGGPLPFKGESAPTVVADTQLACLRGGDGHWRIRHFQAQPLFFGDDPYLNTVLADM
jgi:hypothetical protein